MCSYIDMSNVPDRGFLADEDITCYKVMRRNQGDGIVSIYKGFGYETGKTYRSLLFKPGGRVVRNCIVSSVSGNLTWLYVIIAGGIINHRYKHIGYEVQTGLSASSEGIYSYTGYMNGDMDYEVKMLRSFNVEAVVVRCTIPKGSRYYVSDDGETYVSDNITIDAVIDAA